MRVVCGNPATRAPLFLPARRRRRIHSCNDREESFVASEHLHAPRERLTPKTIARHQAIVSLMEELEAADWYQQRADDCEDPALKAILLHNMREEIEHASMVLEWLRRNSSDFEKELRTYLFSEGDILTVEERAEAKKIEKGDRP
jgi:hypothetical protein